MGKFERCLAITFLLCIGILFIVEALTGKEDGLVGWSLVLGMVSVLAAVCVSEYRPKERKL